MEMYKKPVMEIVELEKVDVLTCSWSENCTKDHPHSQCSTNNYECGCTAHE